MEDAILQITAATAAAHSRTIVGHLKSLKTVVDDKLSRVLEKGLSEYILASAARYKTVKTIINRTDPVDFSSIYVKQNIRLGTKTTEETVPDSDILTAKVNSRLVITGTAGSGKSMLMRYLLLTCLARPDRPLPIFIELRRTNEMTTFALGDLLEKTVTTTAEGMSTALLQKLLTDGRVVVLLDGYDEVLHDQRENVAKQITDFSHKYPATRIIISSRPYEALEFLEGFKVAKVIEMTLAQTLEVVNRLKYDPLVKTKFSDALKKGLHKTHKSFIANPLLVTMMLLTFEQHASIPEKMHIFYAQAFETLFMRHDASKDMWVRKSYCGLQIDKFRDILCNFSAITYLNEQFTFESADLMKTLRESIKLEDAKNTLPDQFLKDLEESVCILQRDGLFYTYTHRSFQEYFCALFLSKSAGSDFSAALDHIAARQTYDGVLPMLLSMDADRTEREWVLPTIRQALQTIGPSAELVSPVDFVKVFFQEIRLTQFRGKGKKAVARKPEVSALYAFPGIWAIKRLYEGKNAGKGRRNFMPGSVSKYHDADRAAVAQLFELDEMKSVSSFGGVDRISIEIDKLDDEKLAVVSAWFNTTGIYAYCREFHRSLIKLEKSIADRLSQRQARLASILAIAKPST